MSDINDNGIGNQTVSAYLAALAARQSTPGGGAVAAVVTAEAAALIAMVAGFSDTPQSKEIAKASNDAIASLLVQADADAAAFKQVMKSYRDPEQLPTALTAAAGVPKAVSESAIALIPAMTHLAASGNQNLVSDIGIAASLLEAALTSCEMNIRINVRSLEAPPAELLEALTRLDAARGELHTLSDEVMRKLS